MLSFNLPNHKHHKNIIYDDAEHKYYLKKNGELVQIPSVTQILAKVGIIKEYVGARDYADYGSQIHDLLAAVDITDIVGGEILISVVDENLNDFIDAYVSYKEINGIVCAGIEFIVYSERYGYAGRIDRVVDVEGLGRAVLDIKTGKKQEWHKLQVIGYAMALEEGMLDGSKIDLVGTAYITPTNVDVTFYEAGENAQLRTQWADVLEKYKAFVSDPDFVGF